MVTVRYDHIRFRATLHGVLPLAFGLVPGDLRERVFARLVDKIENESRGHIGTGLIGGQHLMRVPEAVA